MNNRVNRTEKQQKTLDSQSKDISPKEEEMLHFHKNRTADADSSEQEITEQLVEQFKRFEEAHTIKVPELQAFEQFVASGKSEIAKRQKRDLFKFWLAALPLLSMMLWMLGEHTVWFIGIQIAAAAAGITGAVIMAVRSGRVFTERKQARWNKN